MSKEIHQPSPQELKDQLARIEAHKDAQALVRQLNVILGRLIDSDYVNENLEEANISLGEVEAHLNLSQDEVQEWVDAY